MEKEKMIKEMAHKLSGGNCGNCINCEEEDCEYYYNACKLVDEGYRKVPEGAVVLTREEYDRFEEIRKDTIQKKEEYIKGLIELKEEKENVRKETVMGFTTNFENNLYTINPDFQTDDAFPEALYLMREIDDAIDKTLKDFGVEVEE